MVAHASRVTTDHEEIRRWAQERGGCPATVRESADTHEFFEAFEEKNLAMVLQDRTADGSVSRFNKIISRDEADQQSAR